MASSIKLITAEIAKLEEEVAKLALELEQVYAQYLELFTQSVAKQLIVASYQICTQAYPESFLRLSFNQRHDLQNQLRGIGQKLETKFSGYWEEGNSQSAGESLSAPNNSQPTSASKQDSSLPPTTILNNPDQLVKKYQKLEQEIQQTLELISRQANRYLQKAEILPNSLPAKVLEMALQTEENEASSGGIPNLLNLLVETEEEVQKETNVTKITAIRLRLQEVEFAQTKLSNARNHISHLWQQLKKIRQHYQLKQQQLSVLEAEAAWRASWYED